MQNAGEAYVRPRANFHQAVRETEGLDAIRLHAVSDQQTEQAQAIVQVVGDRQAIKQPLRPIDPSAAVAKRNAEPDLIAATAFL
jgi:hypothetical protein